MLDIQSLLLYPISISFKIVHKCPDCWLTVRDSSVDMWGKEHLECYAISYFKINYKSWTLMVCTYSPQPWDPKTRRLLSAGVGDRHRQYKTPSPKKDLK